MTTKEDSAPPTEIVDGCPDGYPHCTGCGYVFENDQELMDGDCECEDVSRKWVSTDGE